MHSCFALVHYFPVMHSDSCNNMILINGLVMLKKYLFNYCLEVLALVNYKSNKHK